MFSFFLLVSCFKCCFGGDETDPCILELDCKDGCVNVTKDGGKGTSRNCWNKNDLQKEGCNKYGNEEICICYAELANDIILTTESVTCYVRNLDYLSGSRHFPCAIAHYFTFFFQSI